MNPTIPDKLYFKIGEVAKMADVPPHVLRYWESEFTAIRPKRANSGQRLYRKDDVELILHIKILLHKQGFTIAGAKRLLKSGQIPSTATTEGSAGRINPATCNRTPRHASPEAGQILQAVKQQLLDLQHMISQERDRQQDSDKN